MRGLVGRGSTHGRRGQSTLEYILVLAAILVAIIAITLAALRPAVQATMSDSATAVRSATGKIQKGLNLGTAPQ